MLNNVNSLSRLEQQPRDKIKIKQDTWDKKKSCDKPIKISYKAVNTANA